jgi:uncharacterized protein (DUF924 family)/alkylated DNA repair dioxygenase AlkB/Ran GTPase-activating protein (RanGAP) involved in mRNA processing and transport
MEQYQTTHYGDSTAFKLENENIETTHVNIGSGDTYVTHEFISEEESAAAFQNLFNGEIQYQQWHHMPDKNGKLLPLSRLKIAMADEDEDGWTPHYRFPVNNQEHHNVHPFSKTVAQIRDKLVEHTKIPFNHSVVLLYRDGNDCIGFHKDKMLDLSPDNPIASISFGQERVYMLRDNIHNPTQSQELKLKNGTLLQLGPKTNDEWYHSVPMDKNNNLGPRISITFRVVTTFRNKLTGEMKGQGEKYSDYNWPLAIGGAHINYADEILDFWFGKNRDECRSGLWWSAVHPTDKNLQGEGQVDKYIARKWGTLLEKYLNKNIDLFTSLHLLKSWMDTNEGIVALMILFDQFSRNVYRGSPQSFAFDDYAISLAKYLLDNKMNELSLPYKLFVYVTLMHSENASLVSDTTLDILKLSNDEGITEQWKKCAIKMAKVCQEHSDVLEKFGRYPHRNQILGRENTLDETDMLSSRKSLPPWMRSAMPKSENTNTNSAKNIKPKRNVADQTNFGIQNKLKILVLHSNRQTSTIFRTKTEKILGKKLCELADLTYCESPQVYVPMGEAKRLIEQQGYTTIPNRGETKIWWNATDDPKTMVYVGLEQSLEFIDKQFKDTPYDGIIGFSQGGSLTGIISSLVHDSRNGKKVSNSLENVAKSLKFVAMISGFYCRDTRPEFQNCLLECIPSEHAPDVVEIRKDKINIPSFHTWGLTDTLVNPWRSEKLSEAFDDSMKTVHIHQSSHFAKAIKHWPVDQLYNWLKQFIVEPDKIDLSNINVDNGVQMLGHIIKTKTYSTQKTFEILQTVFKTSENIYNTLMELVHRDDALWKQLIDLDTEQHVDEYRKVLVSMIGNTLKDEYEQFCSNKSESSNLPSKLAQYAPRHNIIYRKSRLYHEVAMYFGTIINLFDKNKKCIDKDDPKREMLQSYNQYRKAVAQLCAPLNEQKKQTENNVNPKNKFKFKVQNTRRNNLEEMIKVPLSDRIINPTPVAVDIAIPQLLTPLYDFLRFGEKSEVEMQYERGTVCTDGRLDLCKQVIGPVGVSDLISSLQMDSMSTNPKVKHLLLGNNICGNELGHAVGRFIKSGQSALTSWYIAGNNLDADGVKPVCDALCNDTQVNQLWLKRNPIRALGIVHIVNMLSHNTYLKVLDVTNTGLMDEGGMKLIDNIPPTLKYLYVDSNGLTDKFCEVASTAIPKTKLIQIGLGCNRFGDTGAKHLGLMLANSNCELQSLEIASCGIGANGAKDIAEALKTNNTLVCLNFGLLKSTNDLDEVPNMIGSQGAVYFADMLSTNKTLRSLDFTYNAIQQSGISALANVISNHNNTLIYFNLEQFGVPHNELSREIIRKSVKKNKESIDEDTMKQIDYVIFPPHLEEIKSVYRVE